MDRMRRVFRWIGIAAAVVVALVLLVVAIVGVVSWRRINRVHTVDVVVPRSPNGEVLSPRE